MDEGQVVMASQQLSKHVSPDGLLTFVVAADEAGDVALGFEGYPWHTHADILAEICGTTQKIAVAQFLDELLGSRAVIAIATIAGRIADVWVSDDPAKPDPHKPDDEAIAFRFWNGTPWRPEPFGKIS